MLDYQRQFIEFTLKYDVLRFGNFVLKSGRKSPYFFNSGLFNDGKSLFELGKFYAKAIKSSGLDFDMLFGPAYKGIPLASAVAMVFAQDYQQTLPYCFNRKEEKDHGEGGLTLGAPLQGKVLIIDDVITTGTSVSLSVDIISKSGATPVAIAIALDRQERGHGMLSAIEEVEQCHGVKGLSIITLANLIDYLSQDSDTMAVLDKLMRYRDEYGKT